MIIDFNKYFLSLIKLFFIKNNIKVYKIYSDIYVEGGEKLFLTICDLDNDVYYTLPLKEIIFNKNDNILIYKIELINIILPDNIKFIVDYEKICNYLVKPSIPVARRVESKLISFELVTVRTFNHTKENNLNIWNFD